MTKVRRDVEKAMKEERARRAARQPYPLPIDRNRPPPPALPRKQEKRRWDMNKKAPPSWQRRTDHKGGGD